MSSFCYTIITEKNLPRKRRWRKRRKRTPANIKQIYIEIGKQFLGTLLQILLDNERVTRGW